MTRPIAAGILASALAVALTAFADAPSTPYAGQQARAVKSLPDDHIADYLAGRGMGLAKPAELNSYPGPMHVLELAAQIDLTPEQKARTEGLIPPMREEAKRLGALYIQKERELDELFASKRVMSEALEAKLKEIADLQAEIRLVHLRTHLAQAEILTPEQIGRYNHLQGYGSAESGHTGHSGGGH